MIHHCVSLHWLLSVLWLAATVLHAAGNRTSPILSTCMACDLAHQSQATLYGTWLGSRAWSHSIKSWHFAVAWLVSAACILYLHWPLQLLVCVRALFGTQCVFAVCTQRAECGGPAREGVFLQGSIWTQNRGQHRGNTVSCISCYFFPSFFLVCFYLVFLCPHKKINVPFAKKYTFICTVMFYKSIWKETHSATFTHASSWTKRQWMLSKQYREQKRERKSRRERVLKLG